MVEQITQKNEGDHHITYFKLELGNMIKPLKEKLYSFGSKVGNSYQTQLRVERSQLNVSV